MRDPKNSRPTMVDVAKLSGVSYQTVSRVINNHPYVSDETRQRVQEAINTLGYRPNKAATNLRAKSTKSIAIILYGAWFYGPTQIALNVEQAAKTSGFDVILTNITETQKQLSEALEHVKDWMVDGIVLILPAQGLSETRIQSICGNIPLVTIDSGIASRQASVNLQDADGVNHLLQHLFDRGHRAFCEISGPLDWHSAISRHQAIGDFFKAKGLQSPIHIESNWTTPGGYQSTRRLLQQGHQFTALIAANDSMALGAYRALYQAGLRIPDDISVVGFDDIPEAAYFHPPLTTVRHNFIELGTQGFEYLLQLMDDPTTEIEQKYLIPKLILRESIVDIP